MFDNNTINGFVNQIVFAVDDILKDKKVSQELLDYLYLVVAGMVINYGTEYIGDVYKMLSSVIFADGKEDVYSKVDARFKEQLDHEFEANKHTPAFTTFEIEQKSHFGFIPMFDIKYVLCIIEKNYPPIMLLEFIAHELNHILMSAKKTFTYDNGSFYLRNGMFKARLAGNRNPNGEGRGINEVINTLQTEDLIKNILSLSCYEIDNPKFKRALNKVRNIDYKNYRATGYEILVNLFRPLYEEESIKNLFFRNVIEGNLNAVYDYFDSVLGKGSFDDMSKKLDYLYQKYTSSKVGRSISEYEFSYEMVGIRDSFVKKFYDKKFGYKNEKKVSV